MREGSCCKCGACEKASATCVCDSSQPSARHRRPYADTLPPSVRGSWRLSKRKTAPAQPMARTASIIFTNPWNDIKKSNVPSTSPEEGVAFSEREVETMINNLALNMSERERRSVELAQMVLAIGMWAGLRPSEIAALKFEDIDLDRGTIRVHSAHVYGKTKQNTKTGKDRVVFYLSPLAGRLRLWISEHQHSINGWLLENRDGNPLNLHDLAARNIGPSCQKYVMHCFG